METFLKNFNPVIQALLAGIFTWGLTALGAATVFITKEMNEKIINTMLGFAGGIMIAASYWSLLAPAIEMSKGKYLPVWFPAAVGFLLGSIFLWSMDKILPHLHPGLLLKEAEGIKTSVQRSTLLILAVTLHNIPEGLAIGVAFGAIAGGFPSATLSVAVALAVGIGIQNFPEGLAISIPLRCEGMTKAKSFWYGQLSGIVEPISSVLGAVAVIMAKPILPYALSFAAGTMIFVVVEELIPASQRGKNTDLATLGAILGFTIMMILDVAFS
jgi:zinc transporter, ZIP family